MRPTTAKKLRRDERRRTCYCYLVPGCSSPARASHQNFQTLLPSEPPIRVPTPSLSREPIRARCSERLPSGSQSAQARALKRHRSRARRRPSCLQDATLFNPTDKSAVLSRPFGTVSLCNKLQTQKKSRTCDSSSQLARCRSRWVDQLRSGSKSNLWPNAYAVLKPDFRTLVGPIGAALAVLGSASSRGDTGIIPCTP